MIVHAIELVLDVLWIPGLVLLITGAACALGWELGDDEKVPRLLRGPVVELRAPWVVQGLEREPMDEGRCTCHAAKRCAYCLLREWRAEREELESC